jgi:hypothetical protein
MGPQNDYSKWSEEELRRAESEEHTSELQTPEAILYAVLCLKKKKKN